MWRGNVIVIIPDTSTMELVTFVRRLFYPGEEEFYAAVANTPVPGTDNPDMFHTAVLQTPHHLVQCLYTYDLCQPQFIENPKDMTRKLPKRINVEYGHYK